MFTLPDHTSPPAPFWHVLTGDAQHLPIADAVVDLIITDPPYHKMKMTEAWDRQWKTERDYLSWIRCLCEEFRRVLKPNRSLFLFASPEMAARVEYVVRERFNVLNMITWNKPEFSTKAEMFDKEGCRRFFPASERIIFAEPWESDAEADDEAGYMSQCEALHKRVYAPLMAWFMAEKERLQLTNKQVNQILGTATNGSGMAGHYFGASTWELPTKETYEKLRGMGFLREYEDLRKEYEDLRKEYEDLRRPFFLSAKVQYTDVWTFKTVTASPYKHLCEKPLPMLEFMIRCCSRPGAVVLDACMGSGATGVASVRLGRSFIGIEKDPVWVARAYQWIRAEASQGQLFTEPQEAA